MSVEMKLVGDGPHRFAVKIGDEFNIRIENVIPGTHSELLTAGLLDSSGWSGDGVGNTFRQFHFKAVGVGSAELRFPPMKQAVTIEISGSALA
jgi:hypothetical protein